MRLSLAIIGLLLFTFNYQICEFFYAEDLNKWWGLKQNIYNIIIAIFSYLAYETSNKFFRFVMDVTIGFCISNCVDRLFFDVNSFTNSDYVMIIITITTATYKYVSSRSSRTN